MIIKIISTIYNLCKNKPYELLIGLCILFIIILALYNKLTSSKGTWKNKSYYAKLLSNSYKTNNNNDNIYLSKKQTDSRGEIECRRVLENIFMKPFNKARPDFLRNPVTGGNFNLELDCFNKELRIGLEYNGVQHYKYVPYFHKNKEAFLNQKYRDDMKRRICRDNRILLIEVPYNIKINDIDYYIRKQLRLNGYQI